MRRPNAYLMRQHLMVRVKVMDFGNFFFPFLSLNVGEKGCREEQKHFQKMDSL